MYTLNQSGFEVNDDTECKDLLYWYSSYQKDRENAKNQKEKAKNLRIVKK